MIQQEFTNRTVTTKLEGRIQALLDAIGPGRPLEGRGTGAKLDTGEQPGLETRIPMR
jgi:hypothetical protein